MALVPLENPVDRINILPNAMNWRGSWVNTEQYYQNDVVISSLNNSSYICIVPAVLGGTDPSIDPEWLELAAATTGVTSVSGSTYIGVSGTTNVTITNNGVRTLAVGTGLANVGTANNPSLINTGLTSLSAGLGISVAGNQITNTGIRSLGVGPGLTSSGGPNPTINNTGVLGIVQGLGITSTGGQTPTISNAGILSITAGSGLTSTGGQNPTLSLSTAGTSQLSLIVSPNNIAADPTTYPTPAGGTLNYAWNVNSPTLFTTQLASGAPANSVWLLDMSSFVVYLYGPPTIGLNRNIAITFIDNTTPGGPYGYSPNATIQYMPNTIFPIYSDCGVMAFDIGQARAQGLRVITNVTIFNNTNATMEPNGWGNIFATYFPNGLV